MTASVITIVANRSPHLRNLVRGLRRSHERPDELVVVDMGSDDDPRSAVEDAAPEVPLTWVDMAGGGHPLPLAAARNAGARQAAGDQLIFLDVDCIPSAHLVGAYREAIGRGGLCCGPVRYLQRFWHRRDEEVRPPGDEFLRARSSPHIARPAPALERVETNHELFWSLSFGTDRRTWERIGGFDESYVGYGGEDTDFGYRAGSAGVPLRWMTDGVAFHQWHPSSDPPVEHLEAIIDNARRFHVRWGVWPMGGWLAEFLRRGLIRWDPDGCVIEPATPRSTAAPRRRLRVLAIPSTHPYAARVLPDEVDAAEDPTAPWWPHPALDPAWIRTYGTKVDVVHVHFGYEHRTVEQLDEWCTALACLGLGLVVTVHDLHNPHLRDNSRHERHLLTLLREATAVITLTEGAADTIAARYGQRPLVVPHPHVAPLELDERLVHGEPPLERRLRIGTDFKHFRSNTLAPRGLLAGLAAGAAALGADLEVRVSCDAPPDAQRRLRSAADDLAIPVTVGARPDDSALVERLGALDVSVLPYAFGTHSGWLELCRDVGTRVVAPRTGHYADQWSDVESFDVGEGAEADAVSVREAVVRAGARPGPGRADPRWRIAQLAAIRARHLEVYQRAAGVAPLSAR